MIITTYRICAKIYAGTMWSGIGARNYGGRWNSKGVAVVYTSESRSLAAMEQLVHLINPKVLRGYVVASISFDEFHVHRINPRTLPAGWKSPVAPRVLKKYGDQWIAAGTHLILAVPSAIIIGEWNYLINPGHPAYGGLKKSKPQPFAFDIRLA